MAEWVVVEVVVWWQTSRSPRHLERPCLLDSPVDHRLRCAVVPTGCVHLSRQSSGGLLSHEQDLENRFRGTIVLPRPDEQFCGLEAKDRLREGQPGRPCPLDGRRGAMWAPMLSEFEMREG